MQWNHIKSFKFTTFYRLETKPKHLGSSSENFLEISQFLSAQLAFEKKQLFLGHSVLHSIEIAWFSTSYRSLNADYSVTNPLIIMSLYSRLLLTKFEQKLFKYSLHYLSLQFLEKLTFGYFASKLIGFVGFTWSVY